METLPGDEQWPEIPDRAGMTAFFGKWMPNCYGQVIEGDGNMTIHDDGRITFARNKKEVLHYRIIETTPHYVVTLVHSKSYGVHFWLFRPVGKLSQSDGLPEMKRMGTNECYLFGDHGRRALKANDAELAEIWKGDFLCHPSRTEKSESHPFFGWRLESRLRVQPLILARLIA
ncbi:MAG: hypothetical protein VB101_06590 [Rhodospirillaceae bacterium]|nr:hypothetical protein [Rhodospirillaceae bacterium]